MVTDPAGRAPDTGRLSARARAGLARGDAEPSKPLAELQLCPYLPSAHLALTATVACAPQAPPSDAHHFRRLPATENETLGDKLEPKGESRTGARPSTSQQSRSRVLKDVHQRAANTNGPRASRLREAA